MNTPRWLDLNADEGPEDVALPVEVRVKQGMALLDEKRPGWEWQIDVDTLNVAVGCRCIVGQLHDGNFARGLTRLGVGGMPSVAHGFAIDAPGGDPVDFPDLTAAWKHAILARRLEQAT